MAVRQYGVNDSEAVKVWGRKLFVDTIRETYFGKFMAEGQDAAFQIKNELNKSAGDRVRVTLRAEIGGDGKIGAETLINNEEAISTYTDDLAINEQRHAVETPAKDTIEQQRVNFDARDEAKGALQDWWTTRMEVSIANQLAGNTAVSDVRYTGLNATIAPSTGRIVRPSTITADQDLTSSHPLTLNLIDKAVTRMKQKDSNGNYRMRPISTKGGKYYLGFIHPNQVYNLRADASTAGNWFDIQKAVLMADGSEDNPIFTGALGIYNRVILHECESVPLGVNASTGLAFSNTRRAFIVGAQALAVAFGQGYAAGAQGYRWDEELKDYNKLLGVAATLIWGAKKTQFNSKDYSTMVISTYAAEP